MAVASPPPYGNRMRLPPAGRAADRTSGSGSAPAIALRGPVPGRYGGGMRVVVDFDLCESNALCMAAAPEVFEVRDDDFLYVLQEHPPSHSGRRSKWP